MRELWTVRVEVVIARRRVSRNRQVRDRETEMRLTELAVDSTDKVDR